VIAANCGHNVGVIAPIDKDVTPSYLSEKAGRSGHGPADCTTETQVRRGISYRDPEMTVRKRHNDQGRHNLAPGVRVRLKSASLAMRPPAQGLSG